MKNQDTLDDPLSDADIISLVRDGGQLVTCVEAARLTRETFQGTIIWRPNEIDVAILKPVEGPDA